MIIAQKQREGIVSDLISRQAAVRLITGYNGVMDKSVAKRLLIQMPSAQPEIIRCKDCKFAHLTYDGMCKYCDMMKDDDDRYLEMYVDGNFFCGFAERRQDGQNSDDEL